MKYQIINGYENYDVISYYLQIIYDAILEKGEDVSYIHDISYAERNSIVFVSSPVDAVKLFFRGYRNIYLWQQGIGPEESYLRHHSSVRRFLYYCFERLAFASSKKIIFVSRKMKYVYEKRFHTKYDDKCFIMPCFSASFSADSFFQSKYDTNYFAYVGSLSEWQCINETLAMYKRISSVIPQTKLLIYTFDVEKAKELVKKSGITGCTIERLSNSELIERMKQVKFGFLLRDDNLINNVATPTKLSTYLSCGVIPIITNSICDFADYVKEKNINHVLVLDDTTSERSVVEYCNKPINCEEIKTEYESIFNDYYNRQVYVKRLASFL